MCVMRLVVMIMVSFLDCSSDVRSRQHGKHEGLQERNQQFDQVHKRGKGSS